MSRYQIQNTPDIDLIQIAEKQQNEKPKSQTAREVLAELAKRPVALVQNWLLRSGNWRFANVSGELPVDVAFNADRLAGV